MRRVAIAVLALAVAASPAAAQGSVGTIGLDALGILRWLGDSTLLVVEIDYRLMFGRWGLDAAAAYSTSGLALDPAPLVHSGAVYLGPVLAIPSRGGTGGLWVRLRGAAAYGSAQAGGASDQAFWAGGDASLGWSWRTEGSRLTLDPFLDLKYLYGYLFPTIGLYVGLVLPRPVRSGATANRAGGDQAICLRLPR